MNFLRACRALALCTSLLLAGLRVGAATGAPALRFLFGPGPAVNSWVRVHPDTIYTVARGYGFEPGAGLGEFPGEEMDPSVLSGVTATQPFFFSATVPREGNYQVKVKIGNRNAPTDTTIKAELRRLMIERVQTAPGVFRSDERFIVNVRNHHITPGNGIAAGMVRLKAPRETTQEAWAWDNLLTLEFNGPAPTVCEIEIEPVTVPTIFLLGDSTVCDQLREPYSSWGQMLPRFFQPTVAVANHGESGETYRDSLARGRLDKIISVMQPGDWLIMQFGHNDQKQVAAGIGGPFTTYEEEMKVHIAAVRRAGGIPVVVSPMERRGFDAAGKVVPSLADYARATREVAAAEGVAFIDLNAMSTKFYEALGEEASAQAFAAPDGKVDNTHHDNYGSYELAKCIVQGIRDAKLGIATRIADDFTGFDPAHPDDPKAFAVPPSPNFTNQRPLGD